MKYRAFFIDGTHLDFTADAVNIVEKVSDLSEEKFNADWPTLHWRNVTYIIPYEQIEHATSGVVKPPSVADLKKSKEQDRLKRIENPQALIAGIRQKADSDDEEDREEQS